MPVRISRRATIAACAAPLTGLARPAAAQEASPWLLFKQRFLSPEGRIIDSDNAGISHSEGQA